MNTISLLHNDLHNKYSRVKYRCNPYNIVLCDISHKMQHFDKKISILNDMNKDDKKYMSEIKKIQRLYENINDQIIIIDKINCDYILTTIFVLSFSYIFTKNDIIITLIMIIYFIVSK